MKNQDNQRIVQTKNGQLLIRKGIEDGELCVKFSAIFEADGLFIEPKATLSFKDEENRDEAYSTVEEVANGLFDNLLAIAEEALSE